MTALIFRFYSNSVWYTALFGKFYPREQRMVLTFLRGHEKKAAVENKLALGTTQPTVGGRCRRVVF